MPARHALPLSPPGLSNEPNGSRCATKSVPSLNRVHDHDLVDDFPGQVPTTRGRDGAVETGMMTATRGRLTGGPRGNPTSSSRSRGPPGSEPGHKSARPGLLEHDNREDRREERLYEDVKATRDASTRQSPMQR